MKQTNMNRINAPQDTNKGQRQRRAGGIFPCMCGVPLEGMVTEGPLEELPLKLDPERHELSM